MRVKDWLTDMKWMLAASSMKEQAKICVVG